MKTPPEEIQSPIDTKRDRASLFDTLLADADPMETIDSRALDTEVGAGQASDANESVDGYATLDDLASGTNDEAEIKSICEKFAFDYTQDSQVKIESYLPIHFHSVQRQILLTRLLMLELAAIKNANKPIDASAYMSRFPSDQTALESAFRSHDSAAGQDTFITPSSVVTSASSPKAMPAPSHSQSRFQPIRLHAKGGLGAVYLAKDEELGRTVALKEIQTKHALDRRSQDRFIAEAVVTGALEHPGIVPVYGMGRYSDGRPYYAMRFVKGTSFQDAIAQHHSEHPSLYAADYYSRSFKSLLKTFSDLCSAMYYAHEHGVIHRDIKPDNVMTGKFGETMVVDWGLAKVIDAKSNEDDTAHDNQRLRSIDSATMVGVVMGTPAYMSPEQANGQIDELNAATDIYSLGATLFTILTNQRPIDGKSSVDVVLNVRRGNIRSIAELTPRAPKALASICYKAMATQPENRYQHAGEIVDDIDRWLADELVLAHRDQERVTEKATRWARKYHTWLIAAGLLLFVSTILASVSSLLINQSRNREAIAKQLAVDSKVDAIERYRDSRGAVDTWLVGANEVLKYFPATQSIRKRMLEQARRDYQKLAASPNRDPELELERIRALIRLGDILLVELNYVDARAAYQDALNELDKLPVGQKVGDWKDIEKGHAYTRLGVSYFQDNEFDNAKKHYDSAREHLNKAIKVGVDVDSTSLPAEKYLAVTLVNQGELHTQLGQYSESIEVLGQAVSHYDRMFKPDASPTKDELRRQDIGIALAWELMGRDLQSLGQFDEASIVFKQATSRLATALAKDANDPELIDAAASIRVAHAELYRTLGLQSELESSLQGAIDDYKRLVEAMPDDPRYEENLTLTLTDLGIAIQDDGRSLLAMQTLMDASNRWQSLANAYGSIDRLREQSAACADALSMTVLDATNDPALAMQYASVCIKTYQALLEQDPNRPDMIERIAVARSHAGIIQSRLGNGENANDLLELAIEDLDNLIDAIPDTVSYQTSRAHVAYEQAIDQAKQGNVDLATTGFQQSTEHWKKLLASGSAKAAYDLAVAYMTFPVPDLRDKTLAYQYAKESVSLSPNNLQFANALAFTLTNLGRVDESQQVLDSIKTTRGSFYAIDAFASQAIDTVKGNANAAQWKQEGEAWLQKNAPGSRHLQSMRSLADQVK